MAQKEKNTIKEIEKIWSEKYWEKEAERIELKYWEIIKHKIPNVSPPKELEKTEHRIETFVRSLSRKHRIGNLHVGLTSSDLEDNIRIKRIEECMVMVQSDLGEVYKTIYKITPSKNTLIAYTHLLPASITTFLDRFKPTIVAHVDAKPPIIRHKGIGGAIGDGQAIIQMGIDIKMVNEIIFPDKIMQSFSSQTVNHLTEYNVASWLCFQASLMAKIANDFRQMFAFGQARHTQQDIGSTAIAGKKPNPWQFERVSGRANLLYELPGRIAKITADCLLERTLTNQSVLNYSFRESFLIFADMIQCLKEAIEKTEIIDQTEECKKEQYHSEEQMINLILRGLPREEAHKKINVKYLL